jgi:hypothetical protein
MHGQRRLTHDEREKGFYLCFVPLRVREQIPDNK